MIVIYRTRNSMGARDLAEGITLAGVLARRTKGGLLRNLTPNDQVVCWGANFAAVEGTRTLNNVPPMSKYTEAQTLKEKGVPTIEVSQRPRKAPVVKTAKDAFSLDGIRGLATLTEQQARSLLGNITVYLNAPTPVTVVDTWLPRKNNHVGGNDLLQEHLDNPDYYSRKENIVEEYRLHMFQGKSIRAGVKLKHPTRPDDRTPSHPWIRSFDAGWTISYNGFESTKDMRTLAAKALKALNLDFGAVDIGKKADGSLIVLEVNRAPGVEGGTIAAYAKHIIHWARTVGQTGR